MAQFHRRNAAYNVYYLEENIELLYCKWGDLVKMKQDLKARVDEAERKREIPRTNEVKDWLNKVHILQQVIEDIQYAQKFHNKCLNCCPKYCVPSKKLRKNVVKTLNEADELMITGKRLYKDGNIGYGNTLLNRVWQSIEDENVGTIGLYGMGGAGKTTLLKRICEEFERRKKDFDVVISVAVSRDLNKNSIMDKIRRVLNIGHNVWSNIKERAAKIHQVLRRKKFALLLDDVWEPLDLEILGVPSPKSTNNQSKVVFTTRFEDVCIKMQARKFEVKCLADNEAFELFCNQLGEETLNTHQNIRRLAQEMAAECRGLPLALVTVGRSMAEVKNVEEWKDSMRKLRSSPQVTSDSEKNMLSVMKFCYDKLPDDSHRMCFLYCALYPNECEIRVDNLIDRWLGEGFLGMDKEVNIYEMHDQGKTIIERLKLLCLLESVEEDIYKTQPMVKMHDVIRDMALWLLRDRDQNKNKVLVQEEVLEASKSDIEKWNGVERISIMKIEGDWHVQPCPNLVTLCVSRDVRVTNLLNLQSMRRLKVLDLSDFEVKLEIPMEIGELINLEFLNLSKTRIKKRMPLELKNLKNLRMFLMEFVYYDLEIIPLEVIASLERLKAFRFFLIETPKDNYFGEYYEEKAFLEKLESLPYLEELLIGLRSITGMEKLLGSTKLRGCSRKIMLYGINDLIKMSSLLTNLSRMKNLELIRLSGLHQIMEDSSVTNSFHLFKLRWVLIEDCNSVLHLTWLKFAPFLEVLWVNNCQKIEEVVKGHEEEDQMYSEDVDDMFLNLRRLYLLGLPKLRSIHKKTLSFRSLKFINITDCPDLKKLPFSANSARNSLTVIQGCPKWWDSLEWEEPAIKEVFQSKFRIDSDYPDLST